MVKIRKPNNAKKSTWSLFFAFLDTLTKDEIDRLKNNEPVIKDFAGDAVLINFTTRFEDIPEGANLADHMEIKAMPLVDFNNSWRKKMAKNQYFWT